MTPLSAERPRRFGSRVHGPRRVLAEFRRLRGKIEKAYAVRAETAEEQRWCCTAADALDRLILAGEAVLPGFGDPRPSRHARKRATRAAE